MEHVTTGGAVGAALSPWWLPSLASISSGAAAILPILGVVWLLVQITTRLWTFFRK